MIRARAPRVFITGASSGIGRALAKHYGRSGAILGLAARREALLQALIDEIGSEQAVAYRVDVRDGLAMHAAARDFIARHGVPNIVIANAGISRGTQSDHEEDVEAFQVVIDINLVGLVKTFQPFIEPMRAAGHGKLVGISSVAGLRGLPGAGAYSASKAAAINYLESLRVELRGSGIEVLTVMPGFIDTPMTQANPYPMPFLLSAEDAAHRIARIIAKGSRVAVVPWPMAMVARLLQWTPRWLYDALARHAPRKPR